jgi:L-ascorbate metabolism protein UlaG (beta-lactamase superfamily)
MSTTPVRRRRWVTVAKWTAGSVVGLVSVGFALGCGVFSAPRYQGPVSDHFDGEKFRNRRAQPHGFRGLIRWLSNREIGPWRDWVDTLPGPPPPRDVDDMRVTFINHSTVLVQYAGLNILTDPVWSKKVGPANLIGPERVRPAGIRFADLPRIDVVLISHNHYDHCDLPSLRALVRRDAPRIFTPLGNSALLTSERVNGSSDLDWWQSTSLDARTTLTCVPAEHFSGRGTCDRDANLWGGFVVSGPRGSVYFAGDTGWGDHFVEIRRRFGPIRLALLPIGAYRPRWFMAPVHIDPQDAVRAHDSLGAATSVGIHWGTFVQADDGEWEPVEELDRTIAQRAEPRPRFWVLQNGEGRDVPTVE